VKFFLFTLTGSVLMLLALIAMWLHAGNDGHRGADGHAVPRAHADLAVLRADGVLRR